MDKLGHPSVCMNVCVGGGGSERRAQWEGAVARGVCVHATIALRSMLIRLCYLHCDLRAFVTFVL